MSIKQDDIGFMIKLINDDLDRIINGRLRSAGITHSQSLVFEFLAAREGRRTTLRDLEAYLGVSHPTVVGLVRRLEANGIVHTEVDPQDRRAKLLFLEPPGELNRALLPPPIEEIEALITKGMTDVERRELKHLLLVVCNNIKDK